MTRAPGQGPRLHVIARPALDLAAIEAFLSEEETDWRRSAGATPAEELVEVAGRLCYMSFGERQSPRDNRTYIEHLIEAGHHSVLEHATWSFVLVGITRAFTHQFVRHRIGFSYSQLSQQYHDERDAEVLMPELVSAQPELAARWEEAVAAAKQAYEELVEGLDAGAARIPPGERRRLLRSAARTVLPGATETKLAFTANARSLRHFLTERGNLPGDDEMRRVSILLLRTMQREAPVLFGDFEVVELPRGGPEVVVQGAG